MKIAFCTKALESAHKDRGIGAYTTHLFNALERYDTINTYIKFNAVVELPPDVDLVHFTYIDLFTSVLPLPRFHTKTVVTVHDLIPLRFPRQFPMGIRGRFNWWREKRQLHKVDAIVTDSQCSKSDIVKLASIPTKKIHAIYLAAGEQFHVLKNKDNLEKIRVQYQLPDKYLLYVGDLNWNKNVYGLIDALSIVHKKGVNIKLVIVGKAFIDNTLYETRYLDQYLGKNQLTDAVIKLGYVPESDLIGLYNLATIYIQPSFYEGFGLPVLEAMSCGVPVIVANSGSLPEIAGKAGLLVDPYNATDIANSIMCVLNLKASDRSKMQQKAIAQAQRFSWQKVANQMVALYEQIVSKTG